jgi:hypothetical protein
MCHFSDMHRLGEMPLRRFPDAPRLAMLRLAWRRPLRRFRRARFELRFAVEFEGADITASAAVHGVERGLVGGEGERAVDAADGLRLGNQQAAQRFGKVAALRHVGEPFRKLLDGWLEVGRQLNNGGHADTG